MPTISAGNLKLLRRQKGWTLNMLAERSRVDRGTIHRIESGRRSDCRKRTVDQLAAALGVEPETLTGPPIDGPGPLEVSRKSQMNVRIADDARNALALVALRYNVKQSTILHLAPLLFLWAAEQSLKERKERLDRLESEWGRVEAEYRALFPHLSSLLTNNVQGEEIIGSERRSIRSRDILGLSIPDDEVAHGYDESENNPMAAFLARLTDSLGGLAEFEHWSPYWDQPGYTLGREEASILTGGDEEGIHHIIGGNVALHEMPRDIREAGPAAVAAWAREKGEAYLDSLPDLLRLTSI